MFKFFEETKRYFTNPEKPPKETLVQSFKLVVIDEYGEHQCIEAKLKASNYRSGSSEYILSASNILQYSRNTLKEEAGTYGFTVDNVFYPQSRIVRIEFGKVEKENVDE